MAQVDKIQIGTTTYDILQSEDAIFTGVSNDSADNEATSWSSVEKLASSETNGSIFTKISSMFKNIRYLYKIIGTNDISSIGNSITDAITALGQGGGVVPVHTHKPSDLRDNNGNSLIVNEQISDSTHVPSSLLVKQMNDTLTNLVTSVNNKADVNHTHNLATTSSKGFMPSLNGDSTQCLLGNGSWGAAGGTYSTFTSSAAGLAPAAKNGTTSYLTSAYVLTGAGWKAGTKYNTDTTYTTFTSATSSEGSGLVPGTSGLVPPPTTFSYGKTLYLNSNRGWTTPTNTTYATFTGATSSSPGVSGLVPAPAAGKQASFLRGDGSWIDGLATTAANGFLRQLSGDEEQYLCGTGGWKTPTTATTAKKGYLRQLSGKSYQYLNGNGGWTTPEVLSWLKMKEIKGYFYTTASSTTTTIPAGGNVELSKSLSESEMGEIGGILFSCYCEGASGLVISNGWGSGDGRTLYATINNITTSSITLSSSNRVTITWRILEFNDPNA